ncbi:MAG TPA: glycosyltransferase family 87 protein [Bryobacteraceae bacterium]|nr:glycosyltransferase family 87 protein [Bryobacteraceae bacterium]
MSEPTGPASRALPPKWFLWAIAILGIVANAAQWSHKYSQIVIGGNDFLAYYAGGKLATDRGLYDPARVVQEQVKAAGMAGVALPVSRLPVFTALMVPLVRLPYHTAYVVFQALSLLAVVLAVILWPARKDRGAMAVACCWSVPLSTAFANGQDITFLLLVLSIVARLVDRRPALTGVVASLCLAKFHLFLLVPIWILSQKRWRFAAGLTGGVLTAISASFALQGPDWIHRYSHLILSPVESPDQEYMLNLHGICYVFGLPLAVELAMCGVVALLVWEVCRRAPENAWLAILAGGLLVGRHTYTQDCLLLLPSLVVALGAKEKALPLRALAGVLLLPVLYMPAVARYPGSFMVPLVMLAAVVMCLVSPAARQYRLQN